MSDTRTLEEKLRAMAEQDASPMEAQIAQAKLAAMGAGDREPPRRPPMAPSPPDWHQPSVTFQWNGTATTTTSLSGSNAAFYEVRLNGR